MGSNFEVIYFNLLKSALWETQPDITEILSENDWNNIYSISKEQTIQGIMLDAVSKLPVSLRPPKNIVIQWVVLQKVIQKTNHNVNCVLTELYTLLKKHDIRTFLMKGQGVGQNYPTPHHRLCGDIDFYFTEDQFGKAMDLFASLGCQIKDEQHSSHAETEYKGIPIELHKKSATFYTHRLQQKYNKTIEVIIGSNTETITIDNTEIEILPPLANALQLLSHMLRHIITSGLGLRQICDWVLFMEKNFDKINEEEFITEIKELELEGTYKAISAIATDYLGLPKDKIFGTITDKDKQLAKKVLNVVMQYGNFGHYGEHDKTTSKWGYLQSYWWKVKNCYRFRKLAKSETRSYPIWQLHSIKDIL